MAGTTESKLEYLIRSKEDVRLAINRMLVPCPEDTPFLDYGPKIKQVDVDLSDATVTSDDLMEGVIAYDSKEQRLVGTIPDNGPLNFEPSDEEYVIPYGRTDGGKVNKADITKLAEYEACLRIANSVDNLDDYSNTTATAEDIVIGKTAYSNGELIEGTLKCGDGSIINGALASGESSYSKLLYLIKAVSPNITISGTSAENMFKNCRGITEIPTINTSSVTTMRYMFDYCTSLVTIPLLDTSKVTIMRGMFHNCSSLKTIPVLDTKRVTDMGYMFQKCSSLTEVPVLDVSVTTNMTYMFASCSSLTEVPSFKVKGNASNMFQGCTKLVSVVLDISNSSNFENMFGSCVSLQNVSFLNASSISNMNGMFYNCKNLSDESLNNILELCTKASSSSSYSYKKNLGTIGLSSEQATRCQSLSNYQAFLDAGWTIS